MDAEQVIIADWMSRMVLNADGTHRYPDWEVVNTALALQVARQTEALQYSHDQLRRLARYLENSREEERARVAREVHDGIGQILTAMKMDLSVLGRKLQQEHSPSHSRIKELNNLLNEAILSTRKLATELRPAILDNFGLVAAVEWHLREFETRFGIACDFSCNAEKIALQNEHATALFRLIQEALNNVARHAEATEVAVSILKQDDEILIVIVDNGRGITQQELVAHQSLGLLGMRERANLLDGLIHFEGRPGHGTTVTLKLCLTPA